GGDRKLDALVGADGSAKDDALRGVAGGTFDEPATVADALGGDQDALGIPAVDDLAETLALDPDAILGRYLQSGDLAFVVLVVHQQREAAQLDRLARLAEIDQENAQPVGRS